MIPGHADVYFNERNFRNVERLRDLANSLNIPMVKLAMAWVMGNRDITSVIVGARTVSPLENSFEAAELGIDRELLKEMSSWLTD